jgi:hypothetical protein
MISQMRHSLIAALLIALPSTAQAHSWYSGKRDPIFNTTTCCGSSDCRELPSHAMSITASGDLRVTLTLEEARRINPARTEPFDAVIPFDRIQPSEDGSPHICLMAKDRISEGDQRQGFFCIFIPDAS